MMNIKKDRHSILYMIGHVCDDTMCHHPQQKRRNNELLILRLVRYLLNFVFLWFHNFHYSLSEENF